jgi:CelD/BcsL family acetyltransferase involved in cellulose biosynthesis
MRLAWMQRFGRTSPAFRDPDFRTIVEQLNDSKGVALLGFSLTSNDGVVSTQWGFEYLGRYYAYMSGKDPRYDEFSPGRVHLGMVIEACLDRGIGVLELMSPASDYKLTWGDSTRRLHSFSLPFSVKGSLFSLVTDTLLPATRSASKLLPHSMRRHLINQLLHE